MDKNELKIGLIRLKNRYKEDCRNLRVQYALSNNPVKIGDTIKHGSSSYTAYSIKVTTISVPDYGEFGTPECLYTGYKISDLDGSVRTDIVKDIFQTQVTEINGKPYTYKIE